MDVTIIVCRKTQETTTLKGGAPPHTLHMYVEIQILAKIKLK